MKLTDKKYIDKDKLVAEIKRLYEEKGTFYATDVLYELEEFIDTLEVKESLTWEDIRELYIIFAELDTEIEFCKTDIKAETIGYYQEVLKRFKAQKGE